MANQEYLHAITQCLLWHQMLDDDVVVTKDTLPEHISRFQLKKNIRVDGIVGPETLWALQHPIVKSAPAMPLVKVGATIAPGTEGYKNIRVRRDAASALQDVADQLDSFGAYLTSSGGMRPLKMKSNAHRSAVSMHYPAIAFDLAVQSATFKPKSDPFVVTRHPGSKRHWDVWARAEHGKKMTLNAVKHSGDWDKIHVSNVQVNGRFVSLTDLCIEHGFRPIGPRSGYTLLNQYMSSEWWHFQFEAALIKNFSLFGIELLRVEGYTKKKIRQRNPGLWTRRKSIFGKQWR